MATKHVTAEGRIGASEIVERKWLVLAAISLASFPFVLGDTGLSVALPAVQSELGLGLGALQWLVNSYTVAVAVLLLPSGKLADLLGARRVFLAGLTLFTLSSLAAGLVPTADLLFAARVSQGAGAALAIPASLSLITKAFPAARRAVGLGVWAAVAAAGLAVGPFVGAILTDAFGWRSLFLANVPLGVATLLLALRVLPIAAPRRREAGFDFAGMVTSGIGLVALLYALTNASNSGWSSPYLLGLLVLAGAAFVLFVAIERRSPVPLLDLRLFRSRSFAGANTVNLVLTAVMCSMFFFMALYLQVGLGYSVLSAGLALTPMTVFIALVAPLAGAVSDRWGARVPMTVGLLVLALSLFVLAQLDARPPLAALMTTLALAGLGMGLTSTPMTAAALVDVPAERSGTGSAALNVFRMVGLAVGIAAMGAVLAATGADSATGESFRHGLSIGFLTNAAAAVVAAAIAFGTIGGRRTDAAVRPEVAAAKAAAVHPVRPLAAHPWRPGLRAVWFCPDGSRHAAGRLASDASA